MENKTLADELGDNYDILFNKNKEEEPKEDKIEEPIEEAGEEAKEEDFDTSDVDDIVKDEENYKPEPNCFDAPISWKKKFKEQFKTLPKEMQEFIYQREREAHKRITTDGSKIKELDGINNILEQHKDLYQLEGREQYFNNLIAADKLLRSNPNVAIKEIARMYGINIESLNQDTNSEFIDPAISSIQKEVFSLKRQLEEERLRQNNQVISHYNKSVSDFANAKDENGMLKYPHYENIRKQMAIYAQVNNIDDPSRLPEIYEKVLFTNDDYRKEYEKKLENKIKEKLTGDIKSNSAKAKMASSSIKGGNVTPQPVDPSKLSIRDELSYNWDRINGG